MKSNRFLLMVGCSLVAITFFIGVFAPWLSPYDPLQMNLEASLLPPSLHHPFGLDQNGSDILSQIFYGARVSLGVSLSVVFLTVFAGLLIGSISGYHGGWIDLFFMRMIDMIHAFPGFLLALALVAVLGPSIKNLIIAMSLTGWTGYARLIRGEILHLKTREYVASAKSLGAGAFRITIFHLWPNLVGPVLIQATFGLAGAILTESSLSFLGLGAPPSVPTWGSLLNAGRRVLWDAPHLSVFPGLAIFILILGLNFIGDALRDILDPRKS